MKKLFSILLLFLTFICLGQNEVENEQGEKILAIFESIEVLKDMSKIKHKTEGKLQDIDSWVLQGKISGEHYDSIRYSYISYSTYMNSVLEQLKTDINSISSFKKLKPKKLDKLFNSYYNLYARDLQQAKQIYENSFVPAYNTAAQAADAKIIIPFIIRIVEIGPLVFDAVKDIIEDGKLSKEIQQKAFNRAIMYATQKLDEKFRFPSWDKVVSNKPEESLSEDTFEPNVKNVPKFRMISGSLQVINSETNNPIPLMIERNNNSIPQFLSKAYLKSGDKYKILVQGYQYTYLFFFDEERDKWVSSDVSSSGSISDNSLNGEAIELPSDTDSYYIESNKEYFTQILILFSNNSMSKKQIEVVEKIDKGGKILLSKLKSTFVNIKSPFDEKDGPSDTKNVKEIPILQSGEDQFFAPVYIILNKRG